MNNEFYEVEQGTSYVEMLEPDKDLERGLCGRKGWDQVGDSNNCKNLQRNVVEGFTRSISSYPPC